MNKDTNPTNPTFDKAQEIITEIRTFILQLSNSQYASLFLPSEFGLCELDRPLILQLDFYKRKSEDLAAVILLNQTPIFQEPFQNPDLLDIYKSLWAINQVCIKLESIIQEPGA